MSNATAVIAISHGIRTPSVEECWVNRFIKQIVDDDRFYSFDIEDLSYGWLFGVSAWIGAITKASHKGKVQLMAQRLQSIVLEHGEDCPIDIVAHSYGTYMVREAIKIIPKIKVRTLILVGSVLRTADPFPELETGKIGLVLNYCSRGDWVAQMAPPPFGHSGYWGFRPEASNKLIIACPYPGKRIYNIDGGKSMGHGGWFKGSAFFNVWLNNIEE